MQHCAIVTGASRGIGRAIALRLAREGNAVVVGYHSKPEAAQAVVAEIEAAGGAAAAFGGDVAGMETAKALVAFAQEHFGAPRVLVNNAGITRDGLMLRMSEADFDAVLDTNLKGAWNAMKCVLPAMLKVPDARIVNIASVAGVIGNPGQVNYSAAKAGLIGMTRSLAREVASRGLTVNAIAPGLVKTEMTAAMPEGARQALLNRTPMGRMARAEEIAALCAFLCSPEAGYITGQTIVIDGGLS